MPERILLDTHTLLWWQAGTDRLAPGARQAIESAGSVGVSPISIFETGILIAKGRVELDRPLRRWAVDLFADPLVDQIALDAEVAAIASTLEGFHGDPADRILYASAWVTSRPLVTKDDRLRRFADSSGEVHTIW